VRFLVEGDRMLAGAGVIKVQYGVRLHVRSASGQATLGMS